MSDPIRCIAGEALTSAQYLMVYTDGADGERVKKATDATSDVLLGILQNAPADDGTAWVITEGPTLAVAGGTIEPDDELTIDSNGKVIKAAGSGNKIVGAYRPQIRFDGTLRPDAASGNLIEIDLYPRKFDEVP